MESIYLGIVIFLFLLAIFDLTVGVSNDAVNFLNSAIGAKAASFKTIILIAAVGIFSNENGHLKLNPEQFSAAISENDASEHFNTLNQFKNALSREVNRISIDPMRYINKVIVEYKNPGKTFVAPYAPSAYAGMLIDQAL